MKIKAFTIIELVLTMAVAGFVITLSLWLYLQVSRMMNNDIAMQDEDTEAALFQSMLKRDFESATFIGQTGNCIEFGLPEESPVLYCFSDSMVTRLTSQKTDTFHLNITGVETGLNKVTGMTCNLTVSLLLGELAVKIDLIRQYPRGELYSFINNER